MVNSWTNRLVRFIPPCLYISAAIASEPTDFPLVGFFIALVVSAIFGRASNSWMIGCCVTPSSAANETVDGRFSTSLICPTHRFRISL